MIEHPQLAPHSQNRIRDIQKRDCKYGEKKKDTIRHYVQEIVSSKCGLRKGWTCNTTTNVPPCVARHPPCRDASIVKVLQLSPSCNCQIIASVHCSLHVSPHTCSSWQKNTLALLLIDYFAHNVENRRNFVPMFYDGFWQFFDFRNIRTRAL